MEAATYGSEIERLTADPSSLIRSRSLETDAEADLQSPEGISLHFLCTAHIIFTPHDTDPAMSLNRPAAIFRAFNLSYL